MHDRLHAHWPQFVTIFFSMEAATSLNAGQALAIFLAVASFGLSLVKFRWEWEDRRARRLDRKDARDRDDRP